MAEIYEFPVKEAQKRVVPFRECAGQIRRLPDPYFLNDDLLVRAFSREPEAIKRLLRSQSGRERILNIIENNPELFEFLLRFRGRILSQVGLVAISILNRLFTVEPSVDNDDPAHEDLSEYEEDLKACGDPDEPEEDLKAAFPEFLRGSVEEVENFGKR